MKKILLVDDDASVLQSLKRILKSNEYDIYTCQSGNEALELIRDSETDFDLAVVDNKMPGISGIELLKILKDEFPDTIRIILTGASDLNDVKRIVNEGEVYRFLLKPCEVHEIRSAVWHGLAHRDLWLRNKVMMHYLRTNEKWLNDLYEKHPDIFMVNKGDDGVLTLDESEETLDDFLKKYFV